MSVSVSTSVFVCERESVCERVCVSVSVYEYACLCVGVSVCEYACLCVSESMPVCLCVSVGVSVCVGTRQCKVTTNQAIQYQASSIPFKEPQKGFQLSLPSVLYTAMSA